MNVMKKRPEFQYVETGEPHAIRRKEILKKYPEIRKLFGYDPRQAITTILVVLAQLGLAYFIPRWSASLNGFEKWSILIFSALLVGAVLNHWLAMAIHETSHHLMFKKASYNKALAIFANIPLLAPFAMSFHRYHINHHKHLGVDDKDDDLPHPYEAKCIDNKPLLKGTWLLFNHFFYLIRGIATARKPNKLELLNLAIIVTTTTLIIIFMGCNSAFYLWFSTVAGLSFHPVAAHFIHEHYTHSPGQETFSYYGPLNKVTFNVGYHNEHHDFMNIPGSRIPIVKKIAPEYYNALASDKSWTCVLFEFVFRRDIGLRSRIVRTSEDFEKYK
jgi:sphingolipid delta-4 desaturase